MLQQTATMGEGRERRDEKKAVEKEKRGKEKRTSGRGEGKKMSHRFGMQDLHLYQECHTGALLNLFWL